MASTGRSIISEINSRLDLPQVAKDLGLEKVRKQGVRWVACCPFHNDKSPSLTFYPGHRQTYHCFACNAHGDAFSLVQKMRSVEFRGALEWLAKATNVRFEGVAFASDRKVGLDLAWKKYRESKRLGKVVLEKWCKDRGLDLAVATRADLLGIPGSLLSSDSSTDELTSGWERWEWAALEQAGLVRTKSREHQGDDTDSYLPVVVPTDAFWYEGVLFPLRGMDGDLLGFAVRATAQSGYEGPKYRYTAGFQRSRCLYGIDRVCAHIASETEREASTSYDLFVVEGLVDVLRLEQLGLRAVALLGNSLSGEAEDEGSQVQQFLQIRKRLGSRNLQLHVFLDMDDAGRAGAENVLKRLLDLRRHDERIGVDCIIPSSPHEGEDPDSTLRSDDIESAQTRIREWVRSPAEFTIAAVLENWQLDPEQLWSQQSPLGKSQVAEKVKRRLAAREVSAVDFGGVIFGQTYDHSGKEWARRLVEMTTQRPSAPRTPDTSRKMGDGQVAAFARALRLARDSYASSDFPVDSGSWQRLELGGELIWDALFSRLEGIAPPIEPYMSVLMNRTDGGEPRLKVLPCPEDLVLESYVLASLVEFAVKHPGTIPMVVHDAEEDEISTLGPSQFVPTESTVSFAYQFNAGWAGAANVPTSGIFRHYAECWKSFTGYVQDRVLHCPRHQERLFVARLDIRRYYDELYRNVIRDILEPALREAVGVAGADQLVYGLDNPDGQASEDERVRRLLDWILASKRTFGYEYQSPRTLEKLTWPDVDRGVPQGPNLSSWLANIALFSLDKFLASEVETINKELSDTSSSQCFATYARYVDDIILVAPTEKHLLHLRRVVANKLDDVGLSLSPKSDPPRPMSREEACEWLVRSRGMADRASVGWAPPVASSEHLLASVQLVGGTIDRRDALTILHSETVTGLDVPFKHTLDAIEVVARNSNEVRHVDYRAIAKALMLGIARETIEGRESHGLAKEFWNRWVTHVEKPNAGLAPAKAAGTRKGNSLADLTDAVNGLWPLSIAFEGVQRALEQRTDQSLYKSPSECEPHAKCRFHLAKAVEDGLLTELAETFLGFDQRREAQFVQLAGTVLCRVLAIRRVAAITLQRLNLPERQTPSWMRFFSSRSVSRSLCHRHLLSCGSLDEIDQSTINDENGDGTMTQRLLLLHECIERLLGVRDASTTSNRSSDPLKVLGKRVEKLMQRCPDDRIVRALALLMPSVGSSALTDEPDGILLKTLTLFARCVPSVAQAQLLESRTQLSRVFATNPSTGLVAILPTPEGVLTRALLLCVMADERVTECSFVTAVAPKARGPQSDFSARLYRIDPDPRSFKVEPVASEYFVKHTRAVDPSEQWLRCHAGVESPESRRVARSIADAYRQLVAIPSIGSVVLAHTHLLRETRDESSPLIVFTWEESSESLTGVGFAAREGAKCAVRVVVPETNDWLWRIGCSVISAHGLSDRRLDASMEARLASGASEVALHDWVGGCLIHHAAQVLTGKVWWSRPVPQRGAPDHEAHRQILPRIVEDCLARLDAFAKSSAEDCARNAIALVLGSRAEGIVLRLIHEQATHLRKAGCTTQILQEVFLASIRASDAHALKSETDANAIMDQAVALRRDVAGFHAFVENLRHLGEQSSIGDLGKALRAITAGGAIATVSRYLRDVVQEICSVETIDFVRLLENHGDRIECVRGEDNIFLHDSKHPGLEQAQGDLAAFAKWASQQLGDDSNSRSGMWLDHVSPLGWAVLFQLLRAWDPGRSIGVTQGSEDPFLGVLHGLCAEYTECARDDAWRPFDATIDAWMDIARLSAFLETIRKCETDFGIRVSPVNWGSKPVIRVEGTRVTLRFADGREGDIGVLQVSRAATGDDRQSSWEKLASADAGTAEYAWTEASRSGRVVGIGYCSEFLGSAIKHQASHEQRPVDAPKMLQHATELGAREDTHAPPTGATISPSAANPQSKAASLSPPGTPPIRKDALPTVRQRQSLLWKSRARRYGNHVRVAIFQHRVEESYTHPIGEVCTNGNNSVTDVANILAAKKDPGAWAGDADLESCSELRRRTLLDEVLRACKSFDVDILLLPEYSVRPETITWLAEQTEESKLSVWAGTFRLPLTEMDAGELWSEVEDSLQPGSAIISVVHSGKIVAARGKRYPSVAAGEQFNPFLGDPNGLEPLFRPTNTGAWHVSPCQFVTELICSEVFLATSAANMHGIAQAARQLQVLYSSVPSGVHGKGSFDKLVANDLRSFAKFTSMTPPLDPDEALPFGVFPRRTILLVPSMTKRAVDFHVLGQANYLAAGLCLVFCNAAAGKFSRGESCFVGHGSTEEDSNHVFYDTRLGPYGGVNPGIFCAMAKYTGTLGPDEQAVVIADIDPIYLSTGKPRQQMLPQPLTLVAHLPIIEVSRPAKNSSADDAKHEENCEKVQCTCARAKHTDDKSLFGLCEKVTSFIDKHQQAPKDLFGPGKSDARASMLDITGALTVGCGKNSPGLKMRDKVCRSQAGVIATAWPPPAVYDFLPVVVDYGKDAPTIAVPRIDADRILPAEADDHESTEQENQ